MYKKINKIVINTMTDMRIKEFPMASKILEPASSDSSWKGVYGLKETRKIELHTIRYFSSNQLTNIHQVLNKR